LQCRLRRREPVKRKPLGSWKQNFQTPSGFCIGLKPDF